MHGFSSFDPGMGIPIVVEVDNSQWWMALLKKDPVLKERVVILNSFWSTPNGLEIGIPDPWTFSFLVARLAVK